jgi:hypothetical protein
MGSDRLVPLVLYFTDQRGVESHVEWKRADGKPTPENIQRWVDVYVVSQYPGNINEDLGKLHGQLLVPNKARIVRQLGGGRREMVVAWQAPAFMVLPKHEVITVAHPAVRRRAKRPRLTR